MIVKGYRVYHTASDVHACECGSELFVNLDYDPTHPQAWLYPDKPLRCIICNREYQHIDEVSTSRSDWDRDVEEDEYDTEDFSRADE